LEGCPPTLYLKLAICPKGTNTGGNCTNRAPQFVQTAQNPVYSIEYNTETNTDTKLENQKKKKKPAPRGIFGKTNWEPEDSEGLWLKATPDGEVGGNVDELRIEVYTKVSEILKEASFNIPGPNIFEDMFRVFLHEKVLLDVMYCRRNGKPMNPGVLYKQCLKWFSNRWAGKFTWRWPSDVLFCRFREAAQLHRVFRDLSDKESLRRWQRSLDAVLRVNDRHNGSFISPYLAYVSDRSDSCPIEGRMEDLPRLYMEAMIGEDPE
jgi:hypothetical protein